MLKGATCSIVIQLTILMTTLAQPSLDIKFYKLTEQNGLSNNHITSIIKDSTGFLWYGTSAGLNRYDGAQIKIFRHSDGDKNSLKDNHITDLFLGPEHRLWVKTRNGFQIYHAQQEHFIHEVDSLLESYQIPAGDIVQILKDNLGQYWFLHESLGLYCYNPTKKETFVYPSKKNLRVTGIAIGPDEHLQLVYNNGQLEELNCATLNLTRTANHLSRLTAGHIEANYKVYSDRDGDWWIYAIDKPVGVYYIKRDGSVFSHIHKNNAKISLNTDAVSNVTGDNNGNIWLATDHGGVNLLNKKSFQISFLTHQDTKHQSIAQNSITALYKDDEEVVWVGTYKQGVSYYHAQLLIFNHINQQAGLPFDDVNRFVEDHKGNLWIGSNGGGLVYFNRKENKFISYRQEAQNANSISSDIVVSMLLDKANKLWIGTYHGGLNVFDGHSFKRYPFNTGSNNKLSDNSIWEIYQDRKNTIWIGTLSSGLYRYLPEEDDFLPLQDARIPKYVSAIMEDHAGNLWIGGTEGLVVLDSLHRVIEHYAVGTKNIKLSNNYIADILEDRNGIIWVATQDGLNAYLPHRKQFLTYREADGLPDNMILNVLEDSQGKIWISTLKGLSSLSIQKTTGKLIDIRNYKARDGLQGLSFNENAALKTNKGELLFGGPGGFNIIVPENIPKVKQQLKPIVTEFALFNRVVEIGTQYDGKTVLTASPSSTKEISLRYNQNVFSITFSPLDYIGREQRRFMYQLKGFHKEWLPDEGNHKIAFTNLDPGVYDFQIKASLENGQWSQVYSLMRITIAPPFWKTPFAYLLYLSFIAVILFFVRSIEKKRQRNRYLLQQEREETKRAIELEHLKTQFFTNISHDFRTPLSLIMAPIDSLLESKPNPHQRAHLETMKRNSKRLLNLVNQLLDLKKVDGKRLKLDLSLGDIVAQLREQTESFHDFSVSKQITLSFTTRIESLYTYFDHDKLERILFNLLGNAFKFTKENGSVCVDLYTTNEDTQEWIIIKIQDTGIGIPKDQQNRIFERYFQTESSKQLSNQGNGIGLSITYEYVQLLGGSIEIDSEEHIGTIFTLRLPLLKHPKTTLLAPGAQQVTTVVHESTAEDEETKYNYKNKPLILLVDDDQELVAYLEENLRHKFAILNSGNANAAWQKALSVHPDLILSDIQMPGESGIDLCKKIRQDPRTRHIPVILLTAYSDPHIQIVATNHGASDYIIKPFHFQLLISKIENQLKQNKLLEKTYKKQLELLPAIAAVESEDEKFLRKAAKVTEENIANISFSVEELAQALHISRVGLYKRLLTLNGHTPSEFIRNMRLRKAAQLLAKSNLSVAEIAYQVGFNNPKQFSKYFKAMYQVLPSVYKQHQ